MRGAQRFRPASLEHSEFRVMTWNVGYFALSSDKNLRDLDLEQIARIIEDSDVQAVVLQEVSSPEQMNEVARSLGSNWSAHSVDTGHQGQILAILTSLPPGELREAQAGGRGILGLEIQHPSGKEIFLTGVHSPHPARGKKKTVSSIEESFAFTQAQDSDILMFAGDLNYQFQEDNTDPENLYVNITEEMADSTKALGSTYYFGFRIDHIFHSPKELGVIQEESGMIDLEFRLGRVPGFRDHRPIVVTYDLADLNG